jgi:class 3 adenylate cyclase/predicted ATPase
MKSLLNILAPYVPPYILRATLREPSPRPPAEAKSGHLPAAVLFADVSGFTPLTEALAQQGSEGPEEMTRLLNGYFSRMIALVEAEGGEVVKFSGDALTIIFPALREELGIAVRRAVQAAEAMQAAMTEFALLPTSVGPVALGMKIGIGAGEILIAQVGGVLGRWEYVIAGDPLRQVGEAEHHAGRGEIVLSPEAEAICVPHTVSPCPLAEPDWTAVQDPAAVAAVLQVYVPEIVTVWMEEDLQEWLAVLRPMTVLFIGVSGIDYEQPDAVARLHTFLGAAQEIIRRLEGSINKLAVDDKGTIMLAMFGAPPYAHEDDPERALHCALELQAMAEAQGLHLAIGVATGRVFAGPVGSESRREYTVMGDTVNLAARLMGIAGPGEIRCDHETYRYTANRVAFDLLPPARVKGKAGLIHIYRPVGESGKARTGERPGSPLIGRRAEVVRLAQGLDDAQAGHGRIMLIEGEAGIGKSRLVEALLHLMRERGLTGLLGAGRSIEQQTPYRAWRDIFTAYFDLEETHDPAARRERVRVHVQDVVPEFVERLPLLNDILTLGFEENALTRALDTHLRHESLVSFLLALLQAWAAERPLMLILEDAHWLDTLSWDLTVQAARALLVARAPLFLIVVMRPLEGEKLLLGAQALAAMEETERMALTTLAPDEILALSAARLGVTSETLPAVVADFVRERAGGNPFFAEELIYAMRDGGLVRVVTENGVARCVISAAFGAEREFQRVVQALPDTIQGIILSRIDRLPPERQLALKVAAVIGRTFGYTTLYDTLGEHMEISNRLLRNYLEELTRLDLTPLEAPEPELTYIFKHIITQEVAYETLLFAQRRQLHRSVAQWYERRFGAPTADALTAPLAPYYPLLVYHWHQAGDEGRERDYAALAAKWAAGQFANVEAAGYFTRALELTSSADMAARYDLLLGREMVNDLLGAREAQAQDLITLVLLAVAPGVAADERAMARKAARVTLRLANYMEVTSDYAATLIAVHRAINLSREAQDVVGEIEGHIAWGKALWRQGNYERAQAPLERALELSRSIHDRLNEAESLDSLSDVYLYQGDHTAAQTYYQQALAIYREIGRRQGEADTLNMLGVIRYELGDYQTARDYYEQGLAIYRAIGDRRGETMALSNLAVVYCDIGDYALARDYHQRARDLRIAIGDRWGEAVSLVNLGYVYHSLGDNEAAQRHCEQALAIQQEIGDQRGQGYSLTYLGHALAALGKLIPAADAYNRALTLRRDLGQHSLAIDDLAGLARVALTQDDRVHAAAYVDEILHWIETNDVGGIEYPLQVDLTCYTVLRATAQGDVAKLAQAQAILTRAHTALIKRAADIGDETLWRKFLEDVAAHRDIVAAWQQNT